MATPRGWWRPAIPSARRSCIPNSTRSRFHDVPFEYLLQLPNTRLQLLNTRFGRHRLCILRLPVTDVGRPPVPALGIEPVLLDPVQERGTERSADRIVGEVQVRPAGDREGRLVADDVVV